ncbi:MAG: DUF1232 domain-containing protein [Planctomycetes bacterium]|nr:DUF1232 domain-containing protein [Planctomycetota bacterium]
MGPRTTRLLTLLGILACGLYILNPGMGVFELIPDNIPVIGNLDEAGATVLLVQLIRRLRAPRLPNP